MRKKRSDNEIRQFGFPTLEERVAALEELVLEFLKKSTGIPAARKKDFEGHQAKMNNIDEEYPNNN